MVRRETANLLFVSSILTGASCGTRTKDASRIAGVAGPEVGIDQCLVHAKVAKPLHYFFDSHVRLCPRNRGQVAEVFEGKIGMTNDAGCSLVGAFELTPVKLAKISSEGRVPSSVTRLANSAMNSPG